MAESTRLQLLVCEHYADDARACLKALKVTDVRVTAFPSSCGCPPTTWETLQGISDDPEEQVLILGSSCLCQLHTDSQRIRIARLRNCQELILDARTLEKRQQEGNYVLSSGWLRNWRQHLKTWGEDPKVIRELMQESMKSLLCLDTGTGPENLREELAALGEALGLPWEVLPVGHAPMTAFLIQQLDQLQGDGPEATHRAELNEARRQAADRALALEFLSDLSQTLLEKDVQFRIVNFLSMLFGADRVELHAPDSPLLGEDEEFRTLKEGFRIRFGRLEQKVGILEVDGLAFPQYGTYYLNLAMSVGGACALAILNARTYRALADAQTSQQLVLDILGAFYHPGDDLQEVETSLDHLQAYTGADAVAIRLEQGVAAECRVRGFSTSHHTALCDLRLLDAQGCPVCAGDGNPILAGLCGCVLSGRLPEGIPGNTTHGAFWTNDLKAAWPLLEQAGLAGGIRNVCECEGYQSIALIPIPSGSKPMGILQVYFLMVGRLNPKLVSLLEGIAGSMALGLERRFAEDRLKGMNQELETRVAVRTAELAATNESLRAEIQQRTVLEDEKLKMEQQLFQAQKLEAIGTLAGGVAHDFNNILTPILGFAQMGLELSEDGGHLRRNFEMIMKAAERARDLVSQILLFSRRQSQDLSSVFPAPVIKEGLKLIRASLPTTIEIRAQIKAEDAQIQANPTQIHQIMMNLCTNAAHAMEAHGGVLEILLDRIQLREGDLLASLDLAPGAYVLLQISDTGHGMTQEVRNRIFEPFFTTKERGKGTGLGLSVVHGLVQSYRGHISVYSEAEHGTVFRIYLPEQAGTVPIPQGEPSVNIPGGDERILVVDDDEIALQTIASLLSGLGYRPCPMASGSEALEHLKQDPSTFDLVITDMTMPKVTGLDLAREIRALNPDLPVILCSGYGKGFLTDQMDGSGVSAFVQKPYTIGHMAQTIREVLRGT